MSKKVTIIIVSYNSRTKLPACLTSVFNQDYPANLFKVILVDNHSADSSVGYAREKYPQIKIVANQKNLGFAAANNQGYFLAQKQGADYLFLLNDDAILAENCLTNLVKTLSEDRRVAAVQAKLLLYPEKDKINSLGNSLHFLGFGYCNHYRENDDKATTQPFAVPYPSGAACLVKMSALKEVGLFSDRFFMYHEDVDLGWRLRLAGYQVLLAPTAVTYHQYHYSKAKYKFYFMERNRLLTLLINYRFLTLLIFSPALILMEIGVVLFSLKNHWFGEKIKGWLWLLGHWPYILSRRLDAQFCFRRVKDREILKLLVASIKFQEIDNPLLALVNPLTEIYFWLAKFLIIW